jgi:hypothetical protein
VADFDRTDEYAPDSELDSDNSSSVVATLHDGTTCEIWLYDWVDCQENIIPEDPYWGYAYQVEQIADGNIFIKCYNQVDDVYELAQLSPSVITNVFRHVVKS